MKALVKTKKGFGNVELLEIPEPSCKDDEIKIRIRAIGVCGTDIHIYEGKFPYFNTPVILGHEFTGEIVKIGKNLGYTFVQQDIEKNELYAADEIFLTSTARGVKLVSQVNSKKIVDSSRTKIGKILQKKYIEIIFGKNAKYNKWLSCF